MTRREPRPHTPAVPGPSEPDAMDPGDSIELLVLEPDGSASRVICVPVEGSTSRAGRAGTRRA